MFTEGYEMNLLGFHCLSSFSMNMLKQQRQWPIMKDISDSMFASTAEVDAMLRADFESMPPFAQDKMLDLLRQANAGKWPASVSSANGEPRSQAFEVCYPQLYAIVS